MLARPSTTVPRGCVVVDAHRGWLRLESCALKVRGHALCIATTFMYRRDMKHGLVLSISMWLCACSYDPIGGSMVGDSGAFSDGAFSDGAFANDASSDEDADDSDAMATTDAGACDQAVTLPASIDEDMTVGPGCVRILATSVTDGATLTIAAGTRVLMEPGAFLEVSTFRHVAGFAIRTAQTCDPDA